MFQSSNKSIALTPSGQYSPSRRSAAVDCPRGSASVAREVHFSRDNVVPFQPAGLPATKEWIQIDRADAADYEKDLELFRQSLEFVKGGGR